MHQMHMPTDYHVHGTMSEWYQIHAKADQRCWAQESRQITTSATHHSVFTGLMPFLTHNQQRQSTES